MSRASIIFSLFVALSVTVTASAKEEPKIKVYGNKTPTMIGTPEQIAKYRQELADKERLNDAQVTYSYVDENGNRVTVQSNKNNNYGINYGGGFYYDGYWQGTNSNSNVAYPPPPPPPPPHWAPNSPTVATGPDGVPLEPPGGFPTPALP